MTCKKKEKFQKMFFGNTRNINLRKRVTKNDIALRKVNVKPYESDKTYMNKDLIEDKICQIINQINGKKILFNTCKVLFNTFKQNTSIL